VILPGSTLGVLGGGQLGRMFVQAATRMGYRTVVLDADTHSPAGLVAHEHIVAAPDDAEGLKQLAGKCQAITTEFENVSAAAMAQLAQERIVSPLGAHVAIAQDRALEKAMLSEVAVVSGDGNAAPVAHVAVNKLIDLTTAPDECFPGLLKTATLGYDGKGQVKVNTRAQASIAFKQLGSVACVLEQFVPLAAECSVVIARGQDGSCVTLPVARNQHINGILAASEVFEGNLPGAVIDIALNATKSIANHLQYVGVLCVEFFVLKDANGQLSESSSLCVNELAPRPHNSGHWSMEGSSCSQFELQVRTLCRLPLAPVQQLAPSVMLNLLGDSWLDEAGAVKSLHWNETLMQTLHMPGVNLHLYGKTEPRKGRKMGHITFTGASPQEVCTLASEVAQMLNLPYQPSLAI
jgi:5-(carboxyamino)imidazole ribonucleotide synthase